MKNLFALLIILFSSVMASAQTKIYLTAGDRTVTATLDENSATRTLVTLLDAGPVTVAMEDYGGFEKVGSLPQALPATDRRITTGPGDIMLYQGRNMVIFYGTNTWSYTPLGKIDGATAASVRQFLGSGDVDVTLSLQPLSALEPTADDNRESVVYNLNGIPVKKRPLPPGVYIINGKKTLIR